MSVLISRIQCSSPNEQLLDGYTQWSFRFALRNKEHMSMDMNEQMLSSIAKNFSCKSKHTRAECIDTSGMIVKSPSDPIFKMEFVLSFLSFKRAFGSLS